MNSRPYAKTLEKVLVFVPPSASHNPLPDTALHTLLSTRNFKSRSKNIPRRKFLSFYQSRSYFSRSRIFGASNVRFSTISPFFCSVVSPGRKSLFRVSLRFTMRFVLKLIFSAIVIETQFNNKIFKSKLLQNKNKAKMQSLRKSQNRLQKSKILYKFFGCQ